MGTLPTPDDFAKDPRTRIGGRFDGQGSALEALATARSIVATSKQNDINTSDAFSVGSYGVAMDTPVVVPDGYSQCYVLMFVSAGQSLSGTNSGNVGVQPRVIVAASTYSGPAIANGVTGGGPVSVSSMYAQLLTSLPSGSTFTLRVMAANQGTVSSGSCNVHLSASLIFLR